MLELLRDDKKDKQVLYYIFTSSVRHVEFICERIELLDNKKNKDNGLISELRQACTNDAKYEKEKLEQHYMKSKALMKNSKTNI